MSVSMMYARQRNEWRVCHCSEIQVQESMYWVFLLANGKLRVRGALVTKEGPAG